VSWPASPCSRSARSSLFGNAGQPVPPPSASAAGILVSGNAMGESTAPVTIEEWGDFQCPACRAFAVATEPQLRTTYVATGKVRFVFHHLAFIGQESTWAAEAAECAGEEGRFFDFHDKLYALQSGENIGTFTKANLQKIAHDLGLSAGFAACLTSEPLRAARARRHERRAREGRDRDTDLLRERPQARRCPVDRPAAARSSTR